MFVHRRKTDVTVARAKVRKGTVPDVVSTFRSSNFRSAKIGCAFPPGALAHPGIGKVQRGGRSLGAPYIHVAQMEDMATRDFDLTPVRRSTIGFDRLLDLIDDSFRLQGEDNYPPYNTARVGEDQIHRQGHGEVAPAPAHRAARVGRVYGRRRADARQVRSSGGRAGGGRGNHREHTG